MYLKAATYVYRQSDDSCLDAFFFVFSAHDVALSKQHKSISASDVLKALEMLEFTDMVVQLQGELQGSYFFDLLPSLPRLIFCTSTVYRQLVKTGEKKLEKKKSSISATGPVPSSSRKTMQPPLPDGPISPEGASIIPQDNHEPDVPMDVDTTMDEEDRHVDEQDVREVEEVGVEEGIPEDDPILESDEGESDLLEDKVALEEEELRKDHKGLDESSADMVVYED